jgi:predicted nucleic acid-binding protein
VILTDAGPLVAIIDRDDADHAACAEALTGLRGPMVTSWPALTEAVYLLGSRAGWKGQEALLRLVGRGDVTVAELKREDVSRCRDLMGKYRSLPMDFADATLVVLAEKLKTRRVFTLDSDFRVYRIGGRRAFEVVPEV